MKGGEKGGPTSHRQPFKVRQKIWEGRRAERLEDQGHVLPSNNMEERQARAGFC